MPANTHAPPVGTTASPWMTKREAARYLRISVETLDRWHREMPAEVIYHRVAGLQSIRLRRDELDGIHRPVE